MLRVCKISRSSGNIRFCHEELRRIYKKDKNFERSWEIYKSSQDVLRKYAADMKMVSDEKYRYKQRFGMIDRKLESLGDGLKILDVGACFDSDLARKYDVCGIDLMPADDMVTKCDFLKKIFDQDST